MDDNGRSTAYADLLSALLALRADPATSRFDAELAAAEAAGLIDGAVARTLRWWQRESMRGLADHLAAVLPDLLTELRESDRAAAESVQEAQSAWAVATAALPPSAPPEPSGPDRGGAHSAPASATPTPTGPHLRPVDDIDDRGGRPPLRKAPPAPPGSAPVDVPIVPPREPGSDSPVAAPSGDPAVAPPLRPGFAPPTASGTSRPDGAGAPGVRAPDSAPTTAAVPPTDAVTDDTSDATGPAAPTGAPRTRLLVAGLTVLTDAVSDPTTTPDVPGDDPSSTDGPADDDA